MEIGFNPAAAVARARRIRLMLFDVDGVLTDGTIWVVPTGPAADGDVDAVGGHSRFAGNVMAQGTSRAVDGGFGLEARGVAEMKGFSAHDGIGISLARLAGLKVGFVTKRISRAVETRARDLKIDFLYMGQAHKMKAIRDIQSHTGLGLEQIAFAGDDIVDIPVLRQAGLSIAVANARSQVLREVHWITPNIGGAGAGRDAIEFVLAAQGTLDTCVERYIDEENPIAASADIGSGNM